MLYPPLIRLSDYSQYTDYVYNQSYAQNAMCKCSECHVQMPRENTMACANAAHGIILFWEAPPPQTCLGQVLNELIILYAGKSTEFPKPVVSFRWHPAERLNYDVSTAKR